MTTADTIEQQGGVPGKRAAINSICFIRTMETATEKEVLKEFFRYIGCLVEDVEVHSEDELWAEAERANACDVTLLFAPSLKNQKIVPWSDEINGNRRIIAFLFELSKGLFCVLNGPEIRQGTASVSSFEKQILDALIGEIWTEETVRNSLRAINTLFWQVGLFPYLQIRRTFRVVNMGEVLSLGVPRYDIPDAPYVHEMLDALNLFSGQLKRVPESVYSKYAEVNSARKIREIYNELAPESKIRADANVPMPSVPELLDELKLLAEQHESYIGIYYLEAYLCQTDVRYQQDAYGYYEQAMYHTAEREKVLYAFSLYHLGRYVQKYRNDAESAEQYYLQARKYSPKCFQAAFQSACYYAQGKEFEKAVAEFKEVLRILTRDIPLYEAPIENELNPNWKYLSLKEIQYLYKTYIWLSKIALVQQGESAVGGYAQKALECAIAYRNAWILQAGCDKAVYAKLKGYHEKALSVRALFVLLREIIGSSEINAKLRQQVDEILKTM